MFRDLCTFVWLSASQLKDDSRGISALEYAVLAAVVIVAVVAGLKLLDIEGLFGGAKGAIDGVVEELPKS